MVRALVACVLIGGASTARADEVTLASAHARHSTTLYLASAWTPGPSVPVRIGADAALRLHRGYFAVEARGGAGGVASVSALGSQFQGHLGLSVGGAFPVGERVVFAPMASYDVFGIWESQGARFAVHYVAFEVPVAIRFERVVLEPFLQLGIARYQGATDPLVVIGPRIGLVF